MTKVAIIGAGPIGIEAALYGAVAGLDVQLFERGRIGENVRQWGHVGLFTEWKRDRSPLAQRLLEARGDALPSEESAPSGAELANYLLKLSSLEPLRGRVAAQTEVLSVAREGMLKSDFWGDVRRTSRPFRVLTRGVGGERVRQFDFVIDATGVYQSPNFAGSGGMPAPGELGLRPFIDYAIPDVNGRDKSRFFNRHALVIGSGHSAASTLLTVADLFEKGSKTRLTWVVRRDVARDGSVYTLDPNDFSSGRQRLGTRANELARHPRVSFRPRCVVQSIERPSGRFSVTLSDGAVIECDTVCAHTGFRADEKLWSELQIAPHAATGAPAPQLADALNRANRRAGVGLSTGYAEKLEEFQRPENEEDLDSTQLLKLAEPNFFVLGIKSYGRDAGFLMQNGFRQVRDVYQLISGNRELDLYGSDF